MTKITVILTAVMQDGKTEQQPGDEVLMEEARAKKLASLGMVTLPQKVAKAQNKAAKAQGKAAKKDGAKKQAPDPEGEGEGDRGDPDGDGDGEGDGAPDGDV
ncbi:MAG: hypothetical protein LBV80_00740 [Deltaproteobacteria bacterium]|nr:hypothetical protein [Deltaproteobacteria bacterium]